MGWPPTIDCGSTKKRTEPMKEGKKQLKHSIILQEQRAMIDESAGRCYLAEFTVQVGFGDAHIMTNGHFALESSYFSPLASRLFR